MSAGKLTWGRRDWLGLMVLFLSSIAADVIGALLAVSEGGQLEDLEAMAPAMLALVQLTEDFTAAYQAEKVRRNCMDFSDQEHYAIRLLQGDDGAPTPLGRQLSGRYREIMVDEYQDTNEVQNCIFRAISRDGQNLFTVGDVKQSIYRFRLADPTIFLEKYLAYRPAEEAEEGQPRKVLLSQNFRSRRQVLSAANFVFGSIMSRQMGEMDYGPEEQLNYGAAGYPERSDTDTEFHLISVADTEEERFDRTEVEARFVAHPIRQLLDEGFPVQGEDGQQRPVQPEDIVILMRSPAARRKAFTAALQREDIPCAGGEEQAFFETMEIAVVVSFLQIVDNPRQDVPLLAVLRSPLLGFTPDRLAQIRGGHPAWDYYAALCADDGEDSRAFLERLAPPRAVAGELHIATGDGSEGDKGLVTEVLERLVGEQGRRYDECIAIGPMAMMKFVALATKKYGLKTTVSLNTLMVDGTGMCGACRVTVGGRTRFTCVEGPEFDGHEVEFDEAMRRQGMYRNEEQRAAAIEAEREAGHQCKIGLDK